MFERLKAIKNKYQELTNELQQEDVINNFDKMKLLMQEQKKLEPVVNLYNDYLNILQGINDANEALNDPDLKE